MKNTTHACLILVLLGTLAGPPLVVAAPPELLEKPYLYEVVRHLYRWHLDENDAQKVVEADTFAFWVRALHPELDKGDKSRLAEVAIPALGCSVKLKKADYAIEELDAVVKTDRYKIINVSRGAPPAEETQYTKVETRYADLKAYAFRTRNQAQFPEGDLLMRLRRAAREEILEDAAENKEALPEEVVVHFSALSPVANELWVFWEAGRLLLRFASDIDLANPAVWAHEELAVQLYDIDEQVVVSLDEVAGSNAYLTRDQVGRTLFNCIILGRRLVLRPEGMEPDRKGQPAKPDEEVATQTPAPEERTRIKGLRLNREIGGYD